MNNNLDNIAKDLYGKIQTRFQDIRIGDENAELINKKADIKKARFFEFDYIENGESVGSIAITLDDTDGIVVQASGDLVDDTGSPHKDAFKFIRSFRQFAMSRLLNFDVQNIGKSNLDQRDYEFQSKPKEQQMMESKMFGTSRISYQNLGESRLIVKHSQPINLNLAAGRTMHIDRIYIENADGERFKYPYKHLQGARALAEHLNHGGNPYDDLGKHIVSLSEELSHLRKFKGYVTRQSQLSEAMGSITSRVIERIDDVKKEIQNLQRPSYYEQFVNSFVPLNNRAIPESIMNDWIDRLTIRTFNEDLKSVFPFLYNILDEHDLPIRDISANQLLEKVIDNEIEEYEYAPMFNSKIIDDEQMFESFINYILDEDKNELFSPKKSAQKAAIGKLNKILEKELRGGPDGINAIQSLRGLIDDDNFLHSLRNIDPDLDVRSMIQEYLSEYDLEHDTDIASQLEFGADLNGPAPDISSSAPAEPAPAPTEPAPEAPAGGPPLPGGGGGPLPDLPPEGGELPPEGGELPPEGGEAPGAPAPVEPPPEAAPAPAPVQEELRRVRKLAGLLEDDADDDVMNYTQDGKPIYTADQIRYARDPKALEVYRIRSQLQQAIINKAPPDQIDKLQKEYIRLSNGHATEYGDHQLEFDAMNSAENRWNDADIIQQQLAHRNAQKAAQVKEGIDHKKAKITAKFIKAKVAGATLETVFAEGMTIRDAIRESGLTPCEAGFGECGEMEDISSDSDKSGVEQITNSIEGFWNNEEDNFTIGGTRVKTIITKNFKDDEYSNASKDDVKYVLDKVDELDPSEDNSEQHDILRLAGVRHIDTDEDMLVKELSGFGKKRFDSIDKHKMRRTMRHNYERNFKNNASKFR